MPRDISIKMQIDRVDTALQQYFFLRRDRRKSEMRDVIRGGGGGRAGRARIFSITP